MGLEGNGGTTQLESSSYSRVERGIFGSQVREQVAKNSPQRGGGSGTTHELRLQAQGSYSIAPLDFAYKFKDTIIKNLKTLITKY